MQNKLLLILILIFIPLKILSQGKVIKPNSDIQYETINGIPVKWSHEVTLYQRNLIKELLSNMVNVNGEPISIKQRNIYDTGDTVYTISTKKFKINKFEVKQDLWEAIMGKNPSRFKGKNLPVENVSYNDCLTFIKRLNKLSGVSFRLPKRKEYEYLVFTLDADNPTKLSRYAWFLLNSNNRSHPVGTKEKTPFGIYDILGNIGELYLDNDGMVSCFGGNWNLEYTMDYMILSKESKSSMEGLRLAID